MDYLQVKKQATEVAQKCEQFASDYSHTKAAYEIERIRKILSEGKLVIMAVGEAKTGKSSLLGSYLEDEALFPEDVDIATCLITMVAYAPTEKITVVLVGPDGKEYAEAITRSQIPEFAKEANNPHGAKSAKMILIETPNEVLEDGLIFVDTPGIGSMNPLHSQLTYQFLPRADVVLFVTDATSQISASELAFLKSVYHNCKNILFVLTKIDLSLDYEELLIQSKKAIQKHLGIPETDQIHVPVSSNMIRAYARTKDPLDLAESNFEVFDKTLWKLLSERRTQITILPRLLDILEQMQEIEQDILVRETAFSQNSAMILNMRNSLNNQKQKRTELLRNSAGWIESIRQDVIGLGDTLSDSLSDFAVETKEHIAQCLAENRYKRNPQLLVNDVIGRTEQQQRLMQETAEDTVIEIKENFTSNSGLDLTFTKQNLSLEATKDIVLERRGKYDQIMVGGRTVRNHSFGLASAGTVIGGVLGGVAGFCTMGPAGAILGVKLGAGGGAAIGATAGTATGAISVVQQGTAYDPQVVRKTLENYVNETVRQWERNKRNYVRELNNSLKASCQSAVEDSLDEIDKKLNYLINSEQVTGAGLEKKKKQLLAERAAFDIASRELSDVIDKLRPGTPPVLSTQDILGIGGKA